MHHETGGKTSVSPISAHDPVGVKALHSAALAAVEAGRNREAIELLKRGSQSDLAPQSLWGDLATLEYAAGEPDRALRTLEEAAARGSLSASCLSLRGRIFLEAGRLDQALDAYTLSLAEAPEDARSLYGLARVLLASGQPDRAAEALEASLRAEPSYLPARLELADLQCRHALHFEEREQRIAIAGLSPSYRNKLHLLRAQFYTGDTAGSVRTIRSIAEPAIAEDRSEFLRILLHHVGEDALSLRAAHEQWARDFAPFVTVPVNSPNSRDLQKRLRIGYIGGEFISRPASCFLLPLLKFRNRADFEITCYHRSPDKNEVADQFVELTDRWRNIADCSPREIIDLIRADEIDILVDIAGHYHDHCLALFCSRPAPVAFTFPNYPSTTGVPGIDYIVTDRWTCPEGTEAQYAEIPVRLENGYLSYLPPRRPALSPLPAAGNGTVTFGIFQRLPKYNDAFWEAVAHILKGCPDSLLMVQSASAEMDEGAPAREYLNAALLNRGIAKERVTMLGAIGRERILETLATVDIALDTFPYNGQTTTCECLWMGVPVVVLTGDWHVAGVGRSILESVGVPELAADDIDSYVRCAIELANDRPRLLRYRETLRDQMLHSPLMDGRNVAALENAYRAAWRMWAEKPKGNENG